MAVLLVHVALLLLARVRPKELAALWQLYEATDGANWVDNTGWNNSTDPCRRFEALVPHGPRDQAAVPFTGAKYNATPWYGVGCIDPCDDYLDGPGCTAGRIVSLVQKDNNLRGAITEWSSVGEMKNLTVIDLSYNHISGAIPSQLGLIKNLEQLVLRNNALNGDLPSQLGMLNTPPKSSGELREISLANNFLRGFLPESLGTTEAHVEYFDVSNNSISGTLPAAFGRLPKLQVLYLRQNAFSGTLPTELGLDGGLTAARFVSLPGAQNAFSGTIPASLGNLTQLVNLELSGQRFSGTLPGEIGLLTDLLALRVNDNSLTGTLPTQIGMLTHLESFDAFNNPFSGDVPSQIGLLINLRELYLPNEQLLPLRMRYCQQRLPNVGKYNYRIVREEYYQMMGSLCPEPFDTLNAFGTLSQISGDI